MRAMDSLKTYLKGLGSDEDRERFAVACGTSLGHMRNASYGLKPLAPSVCMQADLLSLGAVKRWETRPDDWHRIWPELIGAEGAPAAPEAAAQGEG